MKRMLLPLFLTFVSIVCNAQDYSVMSEGIDNGGNYVVKVIVSTKKDPAKTAEALARQYAVHGVMFRGTAGAKDYSGQPPLVSDPNVEQTKKVWLDAFWHEGAYNRYTSVVPSSMSVMKNRQTKMYETEALVVVNQTLLKKYLEDEGVIQGLSNLW